MNNIKEPSLNQDATRLALLLSHHNENLVVHSGTEWEALIDLAAKNDVSQMLYTALRTKQITPPPIIDDRIRNIHLASVIQNSKRYHDLTQILQAFESAAVTVVPVKGAWLGEEVYSNIALRGMGDIDLWVNRSEIESARKTMESLGYSSEGSRNDRPRALQEELLGEIQFFKSGSPMIELHWTNFPGEWLRHVSQIDEKLIWQRTLPYKGNYIRQLSAEDAIIHISIHLAVNHQMSMSGLRTLIDIDTLRRKLTVDWTILALRAREWHVVTPLWLVLSLLGCIFGDSENKLPLKELQPSVLRRWLLEKFVSPQGLFKGLVIREGPMRFIFLILLIDKPVDAMRLIWRTLVPDYKWLMLRYGLQDAPQWRIILQRIWHPLSIALKREI
jgi:Uncharacterised nucleotidyltransferase